MQDRSYATEATAGNHQSLRPATFSYYSSCDDMVSNERKRLHFLAFEYQKPGGRGCINRALSLSQLPFLHFGSVPFI